MQSTRRLLLLGTFLFLAGCAAQGGPFGFLKVYRIDIPQGNIVTQEMVDKLKPGMNKRQVRFVMGTPLIQDSFEPQRWDYLRSIETGKAQVRNQQRISLYFEGDTLVRMEGDLAPSTAASAEPEAQTPE
jgi:outer membrane protein assembly factor BamE